MAAKTRRRRGPVWNAQQVRALRQHLGLTQEQMAAEMGTRQQTISEWETGRYQPRGTSARLLVLIAERGDFPYRAESRGQDRD
ncbi:MAG: helix-turn-helix domain-containing protein [Dehalococcoidia bacterium]|nr:helix-turn-helix domain-containing protein [Dehalococcoidia bacterium]